MKSSVVALLLVVLCAVHAACEPVLGVRISDLFHPPKPPNQVRVWGSVAGGSPLMLSDGRAQIPTIGLSASPGTFVVATGDWDGSYFRASQWSGALGVESLHMGYNAAHPALTDALRLSSRIGCVWWSREKDHLNPEDGRPTPYAYHDGYFDQPGHTPAELAARWNQILRGGGDPWVPTRMPGGINYPGDPTIIVLDEVTGNQSDAKGGQYLLDALAIYCSVYGSREDIMAYFSPGVSRIGTPTNYSKMITAAQHYLRKVCLELYLSHEAYVTGSNDSGYNPNLLKGDVYLNAWLGNPIRRWINAGVPATRVMPVLAVSNIVEAQGTTTKDFTKFLNRQFWWLANGRYGDNLSGDPGIITAMRGGVGSYTWAPDTAGDGQKKWLLSTDKTTRDSRFEVYIMWYCVGKNTNAHSDGVDAN